MNLTPLFVRLHGTNSWDEITEGNRICVGSKSIGEPAPKVAAVNVDGINGVIDFSEVFGLYYNNRPISVTLKASNIDDATSQASAAIGEFKRKYHGKIVDLSFDGPEPTLYYTGRLVVTSDDYFSKFRIASFSVDADPFRYYASGEYVFTSGLYPDSSTDITGNEQILYLSEMSGGARSTYSGYSESSGKRVVIGHTGTPINPRFTPGISIKLPIESVLVNPYYVFYADSDDGYWQIEDADNSYAIVPTDANGGFRAPSKNIYATLKAKSIRGATFENIWLRLNAESRTVHNGDKAVTPTFAKIDTDMSVLLNGKKINLHSGETWNPNFVLPAGDSMILAMTDTPSAQYWNFSAERGVL